MFALPIQIRFWIAPASVALVAIVGLLFEPTASHYLAYRFDTIAEGEWWRFITAHFLHTNAAHLGLNILGLSLLWALHGEYYTPAPFFRVLLLCALVTSLGIGLFSPTIYQYVGLSGVLHGLFVWGAVKDIARNEYTGVFLLLGVAIKIGYEQMGGDNSQIASLIEASVAIDAHLWGALGGLVLGLLGILSKAAKSRLE